MVSNQKGFLYLRLEMKLIKQIKKVLIQIIYLEEEVYTSKLIFLDKWEELAQVSKRLFEKIDTIPEIISIPDDSK